MSKAVKMGGKMTHKLSTITRILDSTNGLECRDEDTEKFKFHTRLSPLYIYG